MDKNLNSRDIQAKKTHDKIYNVAINLIKKHGFENVTIAEICQKAGVSVGSFYNHFKNKYDILTEIFTLADNYFYDEVKDVILTSTASSKEKIKTYMNTYARYNVECGYDFMKQLYSSNNNLFSIKGRPMQNALEDIVKQGQDNSQIRNDMTTREIVDYLFISVRGQIYDWVLHEADYDLIKAVDRQVDLLIKSL